MHESRRLSRESGAFVRVTPGSHSLERGMLLLRAFLEGAPSLSNSELVARTLLPKATVSRLTRSLVDAGLLDFDPREESYRLAPVCLSLGRAFQFSRSDTYAVGSMLKRFAREHEINVGLSAPDLVHMVYVSTFRELRGPHTRKIDPGVRLPMATSSPGIAYLANTDTIERERLDRLLETHYGAEWPATQAALRRDIRQAQVRGYSHARSPFGTVGVAATVVGPDGALYAINASFSATAGLPDALTVESLGGMVIQLALDVGGAWSRP